MKNYKLWIKEAPPERQLLVLTSVLWRGAQFLVYRHMISEETDKSWLYWRLADRAKENRLLS